MKAVRTVVWKEWRSLQRFPGGRWRLWLTVAMPVAFFAFASPVLAGPAWIDGPFPVAVAVLVPAVVAMMVAPDVFAGERERRTLATLLAGPLPDGAILLGKAILPTALAWGVSLATSIVAIAVVNLVDPGQGLLLPSTSTLVGSAVIGLLVAVLAVSAGVLVSLRADTVQQAQQLLAVSLMVPGTVLGPGLVIATAADPDAVRRALTAWSPAAMFLAAALVLAVTDSAMAWAVRRRFRRDRLVVNLPAGR